MGKQTHLGLAQWMWLHHFDPLVVRRVSYSLDQEFLPISPRMTSARMFPESLEILTRSASSPFAIMYASASQKVDDSLHCAEAAVPREPMAESLPQFCQYKDLIIIGTRHSPCAMYAHTLANQNRIEFSTGIREHVLHVVRLTEQG